jgi:osmotically-inducible protein OsmY
MARISEGIKKDVVDQLYWDSRVDASKVKVTVSDGKVLLSGSTPSFMSRHAAETDAYMVEGVVSVENRILVEPTMKVPSDEEIRRAIENTFIWDPDFDAREITVSVAGGRVTLEGTVDAYWKKLKAEEAVNHFLGVIDVSNKLAITPAENIVDQSIAQDIMAALDRNVNVNADDLDVEVDHGVVTLSGKVSDWNEYIAAYNMARYTGGVIDVINDLVIAGIP